MAIVSKACVSYSLCTSFACGILSKSHVKLRMQNRVYEMFTEGCCILAHKKRNKSMDRISPSLVPKYLVLRGVTWHIKMKPYCVTAMSKWWYKVCLPHLAFIRDTFRYILWHDMVLQIVSK